MSKTFIVSYQTRPESADENQQLVENVFAELNATDPGDLHYASFRLADGVSFIHIVITEGDTDPLSKIAAFAEFAKGIGGRVAGPPDRGDATLIGSYRFLDK
jgi:hypothetical protein